MINENIRAIRRSKGLSQQELAVRLNVIRHEPVEYIRYLLLNQSEHPRSKKLELEIMHLRNEINQIGRNINQIVKNNNSHIYSEGDKIELLMQMYMIKNFLEGFSCSFGIV